MSFKEYIREQENKFDWMPIVIDYCKKYFGLSKVPKIKIIEPIEGKTDQTQFNFDTNTIEIVNTYNETQENNIKWLIHEIAHWVFFNKYGQAKGEGGGEYPYNFAERFTYSKQFKVLKDSGKNFETVLKLCKPKWFEEYRDILKVYWDNPDTYIKNPFADLPIKNDARVS